MLAIKNHRTRLILGVVMLPVLIWICYSSLAYLIRNREARDVGTRISAAKTAVEKMPPGVGRIEEFVRKLRTIDPGNAPANVKQALVEYTAAWEHALSVMREGQDATAANQVCIDKGNQLTRALNDAE